MALTQTQISQLYVTLFGRASEGAGNKFWQNSQSIEDAANKMLASEGAKAYFGNKLDSNEAFIKHIYQNTFGKLPHEDPDGIKFWKEALDKGAPKGYVVSEMLKAVTRAGNEKTEEGKFFNNKVALSNYTAEKIEGKTGITPNEAAALTESIKKITSDPKSIDEAKSYVDSLIGNMADVPVPPKWNSKEETKYLKTAKIGRASSRERV